MSDDTDTTIPPVLSETAWRTLRARHVSEYDPTSISSGVAAVQALTAREIPQVIAAANDRLPDDDQRKITREKVALMRYAIGLAVGNMGGDEAPDAVSATAFLDALASYLPPE